MKKTSKNTSGWDIRLFFLLIANSNLKIVLLGAFTGAFTILNLLALLALVACSSESIPILSESADATQENNTIPQIEDINKKGSLKSGDAAAFISVWKVEDSDKTIELPLVETDENNVGMYDFQVDWGDGSTDAITTWDSPKKKHTYTDAREYTVTITGILVGWRFGNGSQSYKNPHAKKLVEVKQWGNLFLGKTQGFQFQGAENLNITATDAPFLNTGKVNIASNHLYFDISFLQVPDSIKTTSLDYAFGDATKLKGNLNWDVSQVVSMEGAFINAREFNQDISSWNVENVSDMAYMFYQAEDFDQDIGKWASKVGKVTNMHHMFDQAFAFNQDISSWNVENVTDMSHMFRQASKFNQDIGQWKEKISKVRNMSHMFRKATAFDKDIGQWDVSGVTNMQYMFYDAFSFNHAISGWNVENVTDMTYMFRQAARFNQDISSWNVGNVTNMKGMFSRANFFDKDISPWNVENVSDMSYMFHYAWSFNQDISSWNVANVTNMENMFNRSFRFDQDIGRWDVAKVTNMAYMFHYAWSFNQDINGWNVANVTNMENMFDQAFKFNRDTAAWNVANVINMSYMFNGAKDFDQDISSWNVTRVAECSYFSRKSSIKNNSGYQPDFTECNPQNF